LAVGDWQLAKTPVTPVINAKVLLTAFAPDAVVEPRQIALERQESLGAWIIHVMLSEAPAAFSSDPLLLRVGAGAKSKHLCICQ